MYDYFGLCSEFTNCFVFFLLTEFSKKDFNLTRKSKFKKYQRIGNVFSLNFLHRFLNLQENRRLLFQNEFLYNVKFGRYPTNHLRFTFLKLLEFYFCFQVSMSYLHPKIMISDKIPIDSTETSVTIQKYSGSVSPIKNKVIKPKVPPKPKHIPKKPPIPVKPVALVQPRPVINVSRPVTNVSKPVTNVSRPKINISRPVTSSIIRRNKVISNCEIICERNIVQELHSSQPVNDVSNVVINDLNLDLNDDIGIDVAIPDHLNNDENIRLSVNDEHQLTFNGKISDISESDILQSKCLPVNYNDNEDLSYFSGDSDRVTDKSSSCGSSITSGDKDSCHSSLIEQILERFPEDKINEIDSDETLTPNNSLLNNIDNGDIECEIACNNLSLSESNNPCGSTNNLSNSSSISNVSINETEDTDGKDQDALEKKAKKAFYTAREIMSSERVFVDILKLLNEDFRTFLSNHQCIIPTVPDNIVIKYKPGSLPESELDKILNYLPQLQRFNELLLRDFETRVFDWDRHHKIADILVSKGPFLKLFYSYIREYENQCKLLEESVNKYPLFGKAVKEFELSERCASLQITQHMLKPVQRITQYQLLLKEYIKNLTEESPDFEDAHSALTIMESVGTNANKTMKQMVSTKYSIFF